MCSIALHVSVYELYIAIPHYGHEEDKFCMNSCNQITEVLAVSDHYQFCVYSLTLSEGAAIVVQTPRISSGFARTLYNPQCFLQFSDPTKAPVEWSSHNVRQRSYYLKHTFIRSLSNLAIASLISVNMN